MSSKSNGFIPGALVMLLRASNPDPNVQAMVGTPRKLAGTLPLGEFFYSATFWYFNPAVYGIDGRQIAWNQNDMRLIDPDDGEDEMLRLVGLPTSLTSPTKESENV